MRELAQRLLALEAERGAATDGSARDAAQVFEKLRISLARFAGPDGFASLLRRASKLAQAEVPALATLVATRDGTLEGFDRVAAEARDGGAEAALAVVTHLLGLLVTFVGEAITVRLVRDAWPEIEVST